MDNSFIIYGTPNPALSNYDTYYTPLEKEYEYKIFYDETSNAWVCSKVKKTSEDSDRPEVKAEKRPILVPCKCGKNRRQTYITNVSGSVGYYFECVGCGFTSPVGKNICEAKKKWNEAVIKETISNDR